MLQHRANSSSKVPPSHITPRRKTFRTHLDLSKKAVKDRYAIDTFRSGAKCIAVAAVPGRGG